ncbi:leucine-rich repeat protein [Yasminevirus sp. GU-2018]|uniref:Leucine-rich repeat protein n=1 Tax=Yasminevirus sp. GU-2018 TaxID=2420051 RepID=A0A5K0UB45_9VIRU|nr:leucine-rich repeat protein [Yasminevirus sp. GU-2018]
MTHQKNKWVTLLTTLDDVKSSLENRHLIAKVAEQFTKQISKDRELFEAGEEFSDCALNCPVWGSKYDKSHGLCSFIAPPLFPEKLTDDMTDNERELAVTDDFTKLIRKLRKEYRTKFEEARKKELAFKRIVSVNSRGEYDELAKLPISKHIMNPEATQIDLSPDSDFDQIIDHVANNTLFLESSPDNVEFPKGTVYKDGRLDLCMQGISVTTLNRLLKALRNNTHIKHVLLGNNSFGDEGAELIADFMREKNQITTWYICACDITSKGIKKICDALSESDGSCESRVESLWLKRNPLKVEGAKCIAKLLETNKSIRHLDLFNTGILDEGCEHIFKALRTNTVLDTLYIGANGVTVTGVNHVVDYFNHIVDSDTKSDTIPEPRLRTLFLDVNRIGDEGINLLCNALRRYGKMVRLSVGANRVTHVGMKYVADTFVDDKSLVFLDVGMCKATLNVHELPNNIGDAGVEHIQRLIEQNKTLRVLNVRHNGITDEGVDKIVTSLKTNTTLFKLHVEQSGGKNVLGVIRMCSEITDKNILSAISSDSSDLSGVVMKDVVKLMSHGDSISNTESRYLLGI